MKKRKLLRGHEKIRSENVCVCHCVCAFYIFFFCSESSIEAHQIYEFLYGFIYLQFCDAISLYFHSRVKYYVKAMYQTWIQHEDKNCYCFPIVAYPIYLFFLLLYFMDTESEVVKRCKKKHHKKTTTNKQDKEAK